MEDCEKWDEKHNIDKMWSNFQMKFTDAQRKMRRRHNHTYKQTGLHRTNTVLTDELERANNSLINMAQTAMMDKEHITTLTRKLEEFTRRFGPMEAKLDREREIQMGAGVSASTFTPKKYLMGPIYWKADRRNIWDQGGYCWIHGYCVKQLHNSTKCNQSTRWQGHTDKSTCKDNMGG